MDFERYEWISKAILVVVFIIVFILTLCALSQCHVDEPEEVEILPVEMVKEKQMSAIEYLDAYEKHYDAAGPFVLIDANNGLIGLYYGYEPIAHLERHIEVDGNHIITTLDHLRDYIDIDDELFDIAQSYGYADDFPVVIDKYPVR